MEIDEDEFCSTIKGTAFDNDAFMSKALRKEACFNPDTARGCCMARCSTHGMRCQTAASWALTIDSGKIQQGGCDPIEVSHNKYIISDKKLKTGGEGVLMLCSMHMNMVKKHKPVYSTYIQSALGSRTGTIVCGGIITAGVVAAAALTSATLPAFLAIGAAKGLADGMVGVGAGVLVSDFQAKTKDPKAKEPSSWWS